MQQVPLQALPNFSTSIVLNNQACRINIRQTSTGVYLDLYVNNQLIIAGVICQNLNRIVRDAYLGFIGDLAFFDLQGNDDPVYTGFGTRFILVYLEEADIP